MNKKIYMGLFVMMLIVLAITFCVQIKTFGSGNKYQWYLLTIIIIVGLSSYWLSKYMKKEGWFKIQQKRK